MLQDTCIHVVIHKFMFQAKTVIGTPDFGVTDPDAGDTATYTMDCGTDTGYFLLDTATREVSFQSDFDLDTGSLPTTVSCTVTVTDSSGLTDTATLQISICKLRHLLRHI